MSRRVVAIIDWGSAAFLKENVRLFQRASDDGLVRPREWRDGPVKYRSLTLFEDRSLSFQTATATPNASTFCFRSMV